MAVFNREEFARSSKAELLDYIEQQSEQLTRFETRFRGTKKNNVPRDLAAATIAKNTAPLYAEDMEPKHWPVCPCYPLTCPNECDSQHLIECQNLDHHLAKECPLQVVDCDFHYAGCEVRVPRKDMPQHLTENFTHMSLLATLNQKLASQLLEKDKRIVRLTMELQQLTKKMEALDQSVTKLREEQTRQQRSTEARMNSLEQEQGLKLQKVDKRFDALPQTSIPMILMTDFTRHKKE